MIAQAHAATLNGIDALPIVVEVDLLKGDNRFYLVGLPDKAVQESEERVRASIRNCDMTFPNMKVICNLAPGDIRKEGPSLDLPIAIAILAASGQVPKSSLESTVLLGELGLDGRLRPIDGAVSVALMCHALGYQRLILPMKNAAEAAITQTVEVYGMNSLTEVAELLNGSLSFEPFTHAQGGDARVSYDVDYSDVKGQRQATRALEIAAAGGHNLLMIGPPGSGKSMLAARLPGLLPPLDAREALEISMIQSLAGELKDGAIGRRRPFRAPHHSASMAALTGGGLKVRPGEVSLAHLGVLFLDELPEFDRRVLDSLRQPLETGSTLVARANAHIRYPSRVQLVAAMNPCRCGYLGDPAMACNKAPRCGADYQARISGPLYDRIDLHVDVPAVSAADLSLPAPREGSAEIAARVAAARARQGERYAAAGIRTNAEAEGEVLAEGARLEPAAQALLAEAAEKMRLSARGYTRALRVARTIADLAGSPTTARPHIAEALSYRRLNLT